MPKLKASQIIGADVLTEAEAQSSYAPKDHFASATAPSSPQDGWIWYDTTNNQIKVYNSSTTSWETEVGAQGPTGPTGASGASGKSGISGRSGTSGACGSSGK